MSHEELSPESTLAEATEVTPIREHPELGPAQQLIIDGFFKAMEERRG